MMESPTPRAASVLLVRALGHLDQVEPAEIRPAIRHLFAAGIELCTVKRSLIGYPIESTIEIARELLAAVEATPAPGESQPAQSGSEPASPPQWTTTPDPGKGG